MPAGRTDSAGGLLSFADALAAVRSAASGLRATAAENVALGEARGRVLALGIVADRDQPPFDRSTRDGFAICLGAGASERASGNVAAGEQEAWTVLGEVFAGEAWAGPRLRPGQAVEIMTGAPVPEGADAVVMVEHVEDTPEVRGPDGALRRRSVGLAAGRGVAAGSNIVLRASEARAGSTLLEAGTMLGPAEIALAASAGAATVQVVVRPRVAILSTGDELVELGDPEVPALEPQQIRNSNSYGLAALVAEAGGEPWRLPIVRDTREELLRALEQARAEADLLLLTGGVSAGKRDLVEEVLLGLGAQFQFTGVRMQPGKPVVFGMLPQGGARGDVGNRPARRLGVAGEGTIPVFGLPGNPISAEVTFRCLVAPVLRALCGEVTAVPRFAAARLTEEIKTDGTLTRFLPARLEGLDESGAPNPSVRLVPWKGSGDLASNARANCYAVLAAGREVFAAGEMLPVLLR